ncbi:flavodoxin domain-containing protein [Rhodococcus sp. W8901]|uniref:flavodoxin domain-containing protein n=1 Tax=Rhodococcus sp. W8901 TaxID=2742603 RepID=UPI0015828093|nr:flavodoxin domain-containing protein [Rhodococcus sp. W8901]QKT11658.1 hypothetical protein HUN07_13740 [Rhodococcus sp. W8901]
MPTLIAYASAHGSTAGIARSLGRRLTHRGLDVEVRDCAEIPAGTRPSTLVIGSAVHESEWLPTAARFVDHLAEGAEELPVWAFSVGMVGDEGSALARPVTALLRRMLRTREPTAVQQLRARTRLRGHHRFSGRFCATDAADTGRAGRMVFRAMGGHYGDYREWSAVEAWADDIAVEVDRQAHS